MLLALRAVGSFYPISILGKPVEQVFPAVAVGGKNAFYTPAAQLLHDLAGGVRLRAVAPSHGAGVDLKRNVRLCQRIQRLPNRPNIAGVAGGEQGVPLVELCHQVKMPHDPAAGALPNLRHRAVIVLRKGVPVAAVIVLHGLRLLRLGSVHRQICAIFSQIMDAADDVIISLRECLGIKVLLNTHINANAPGVFLLQAADLRFRVFHLGPAAVELGDHVLEGFLAGVKKKLSNERFVANAPEQVVALERKKQSDSEEKIAALKESIAALKNK